MNQKLEQAYKECERITRASSTSYSLMIALFPKEEAKVSNALYAFARTADDLVDRQLPDKKALLEHIEAWRFAYEKRDSSLPVLLATSDVFHRYEMPFELSEHFFRAMRADTEITRYETYADLERYMDSSAGVIGIWLAYVLGYSKKESLDHAAALGHAMQLTNMLRDVREDYEQYGRIYLPQADLERYGVSEEMIRDHENTMAFRYLMHAYVAKNRALYAAGRTAIPFFPPKVRPGIALAASLYETLLDRIEDRDYDVFSERVTVPSWKKSALALSVVASAGLQRLSF